MISIDRFEHLMEASIERLPARIFEGLNLGIGLVERAKLSHATASGQKACILGEYHVRPNLGRGIVLYYGSFKRLYPDLHDESEALSLIDSVIKHELTHHLEHQAGEHDLELEDARRLSGI